MKSALLTLLLGGSALAHSSARQSSTRSSPRSSASLPSATISSAAANITAIPVYNATIQGTPQDTTVNTVPNPSECDYSSGGLYCFPDENAFVQMTGWTRFFYNKNYGLINGSGLVDITMHFATDDAPAANWIGVQNTGDVPINVNISWFTSTLSPQATYSAADPYYFYVRPNSAVYNAYPTESSRGPTFYAVQTPLQRLAVVATATASTSSTPTSSSSSSSSSSATATAGSGSSDGQTATSTSNNGLTRGAIAGIAIGAIALFFVLLLLGFVILLLTRRHRYAEEAAAAAAANQEKERNTRLAPGNLYTPAELAAAGLAFPGRRPSVDQTDSSGSVPIVVNSNPLSQQPGITRQASIARPARARVEHYSPAQRTSPVSPGGPFSDPR